MLVGVRSRLAWQKTTPGFLMPQKILRLLVTLPLQGEELPMHMHWEIKQHGLLCRQDFVTQQSCMAQVPAESLCSLSGVSSTVKLSQLWSITRVSSVLWRISGMLSCFLGVAPIIGSRI